MASKLHFALGFAFSAMLLAGCGGSDSPDATDNPTPPAPIPPAVSTYTVGGTVSGLAGSGLILSLNASESRPQPMSGAFGFVTPMLGGASYTVTVASQPTTPAQTCSVSSGTGMIATSNISNVSVVCVTTVSPPTGNGDQYGSGPSTMPDPSGQPTSAGLIHAALANGAITQDQALIYEMYADFADPRLPAQYRGDDAAVIEGHAFRSAMDHIASVGEANVSPATLDALRPFITPPYYEGSWWQPAPQPSVVQLAAIKAYERSAKAAPTKIGWTAVPGTNVVVWYKNAHAATDAATAAMLLGEFERTIWPVLTTAMGRTPKTDLGTGGVLSLGVAWTEDDGRLDVFLDDMASGNEGVTLPVGWRTKDVAARIHLNRSLPNRGLIAQAAHEFMHAIQFSYDVRAASLTDYRTIQEATAAWASHFVYPANRWETKYAKYYLEGNWVSSSYDDRSTPNEFRYGAYVLPLFLETRFGSNIVKAIWDKTLGVNSELFAIEGAIIDAGSTFKEEWSKFIAANWNRETLNKYGAFGVTATPTLDANQVISLSNGFGAIKHDVKLPHASMSYYRVLFDNASARSIMFVNGLSYVHRAADEGPGTALYFTGMSPVERNGASMQLFLKVNGVWQSAANDFSTVPWYSVCRDSPAGKIEEAIFMYGNAEITPSAPNYNSLTPVAQEPGLVATDIGCRDWTGSLSLTRPLDDSQGTETLTISNIKLENTMPTAAPTPGLPPPYLIAPGDEISPGFGFTYAITGGTATWTYNRYDAPPINCTYTGRETFPIAGASAPSNFFTNWTPPGRAFRGATVTGFLSNVFTRVLTLSYAWRCVDSNGVREGTDIVGTGLDIFTYMLEPEVRIGAGGLTLSGTGDQSGHSDATGTWSLQGATQ
jgi:hypothetical protein